MKGGNVEFGDGVQVHVNILIGVVGSYENIPEFGQLVVEIIELVLGWTGN